MVCPSKAHPLAPRPQYILITRPRYTTLFLFAVFLALASAQRPENASICDYYAGARYGTSTNDTQAKLIKNIVSLAFGGPYSLPNVSSDLTGILNPGSFDNQGINLRSWLDGEKDSTNLNGAAVGIDWLDGGAGQPLGDYLTGVTPDVVLSNTTNEYRLFSHFFTAFSHLFGCSNPIPAPPSGATGGTQTLSLAYVHKYMDLNHTDLGHFIDQLGHASIYFGFDEGDADTFTTNLNSQYNVRCSPPVQLQPNTPAQLLILCQDPTCLLAAPSPDCDPYVNLQPGGYSANSSASSTMPPSPSSTISSTTTSSSSATTSVSSTSTATSAATSATSTPSSTPSKDLSGGAIAGIVIGSIIGALAAVALGLYMFRLRKKLSSTKPVAGAESTDQDKHHRPSSPSEVMGTPLSPQSPPRSPPLYSPTPMSHSINGDGPTHWNRGNVRPQKGLNEMPIEALRHEL